LPFAFSLDCARRWEDDIKNKLHLHLAGLKTGKKMDDKQAASNISEIEQLCLDKGMRMTDQRRVIARVLSQATDHPDVEEVYKRSTAVDSGISIATVYRTVRLFEEAGILERHDFRDGRSRYEPLSDDHHDHLINLDTGEVLEFQSDEIEKLQNEIAKKMGFKLVDHRMELYGVPLVRQKKS